MFLGEVWDEYDFVEFKLSINIIQRNIYLVALQKLLSVLR